MKTCRKCGIEKPLDGFHKNKGMADGHLSKCKVCACADRSEWRRNNPEKVKQEAEIYYARHREKILEYRKGWARANPDKRAAILKRYRDTHQEQQREYGRLWRERNPDKAAARKARYRSKLGIYAEPVARDYIIERDGGVCHICGKKPPRHLIDLDHLIPVSKGGPHTADNLRVACRSCNRSRGPGRKPAQLLLVG